ATPEDPPEVTQIVGAGLSSAPAKDRYLLGTVRGAQVDKQDFEQFVARITHDSDAVRALKEIQASPQAAVFGGGLNGPAKVSVLQLSSDLVQRVVEMIRANPALFGVALEPDAPLTFGGGIRLARSSSVVSPTAVPVRAAFTVVGKNDEPIEGATVSLFGS